MKQFFKSVLASFTGFVIGGIFLFIFFMIILAGSVASSSEKLEVKDHSVLHLTFNRELVEFETENPLGDLDLGPLNLTTQSGLNQLLLAIKSAKSDENIKAILLDFSLTSQLGGMASVKELRDALEDFKKSGKVIYSYAELYSKKEIYLSSVANEIILSPKGMYLLQGMTANSTFYKGLLDKLDIKIELIKRGNYKGAGEVYIRENLSDYNREQIKSFISNIYADYLASLGKDLKIAPAELDRIANSLEIHRPEDALKRKLVTKVWYRDEMEEALKKQVGLQQSDDLRLVSASRYAANFIDGAGESKGTIAVIYAQGEIISGKSANGMMGDETIIEAIRYAKENKRVKAVVLRINSPGGSALASDNIARELDLLKKQKPLIISMGDLAASGGYMMAASGDYIFAHPNTITGSIGVFATVPYVGDFFKNKLGITHDRVSTAENTDIGNINFPLTDQQRAWFQNSVNNTYDDFVSMVAKGRKLPLDTVYKIAEGRVYSGIEAKKIGLIDQFGGIDEAIAEAAKRAKLSGYRITGLPKPGNPLLEALGLTAAKATSNQFTNQADFLTRKMEQLKANPVQARMSFDFEIQ